MFYLMNNVRPVWQMADEGSSGGEGADAGNGDGGEGDDAGGADENGSGEDAGSILYPSDKGSDEGEGADENGEKDDDEDAGDWKEYETNPDLSDEENEAAKAEHDKGKPEKTADVPEAYEFKMPEGVDVDDALVEELTPVFKDLYLSNDQAQKLADKFISHQQAQAEKQGKIWAETVEKWGKDAESDKEMGGDNWEGTRANALKFITRHGTPELKEYFDQSGAGNHPELIRIMAKAGALISEDVPADADSGGSGKPAEAAHVLYPNDKPKG